MKIGLIRGRHPLPVDRYLIEQETVPFGQAHKLAYEAIQRLIKEHDGDVDLYITGLTRATLGAVAGWIDAYRRTEAVGYDQKIPSPRVLRIWEYNAETGEYESVISFRSGASMYEMLGVQGSYELVWSTSAHI